MGFAGKIAERDQQAASFRLQCWGDFALADRLHSADLKLRGRKARALVAYLALHAGKPVSRERLAGLLWGDRAEEQARASLRQTLLELKPLANGREALIVERDHLTLRAGALATDLDEIGSAAERRDYDALVAALPEPDERLFANLDGIDQGFDDWLQIERTRQRDTLLALVSGAVAAAAAAGDHRATRALQARQRELDPATTPAPPEPAAATIQAESRPSPPPPTPAAVKPRRWLLPTLAALLLVLSLAALGAWYWRARAPAAPATIAVLPFKDLSARSDASFAEGLSEEITAQLAREPGLRVAGRTSSAQFKDRTAGLDEVGRRLGVAYVLEGSVRSAGERVRVNVALAQASDGLQLWAETFDGTLDDVLGIQHRIGANVARALGRKLVRAGPTPGARATSGAVYTLYLSARALIRERNPLSIAAAKEKLTRALRLDPDFAPAWSSLAQITRFEANAPGPEAAAKVQEAVRQARRALTLAPDLAEAHGVLGMILGFEDPVGQTHVKRAAALDPGNAEFQFWLGHVYGSQQDFPRQLAAYRRAFEIDPLWHYAQMQVVETAWDMGLQQEAIGYVRRLEADASRHEAHVIRSILAGARGDRSAQAAELAAAAAATSEPGKKARTSYQRAFVLYNLGFFDAARTEWSTFWDASGQRTIRSERMDEYEVYFRIRQGVLPSLPELRAQSASPFHKDQAYAALGAKLLINAGRARDVVALYDSGNGFLGLSRAQPASRASNHPVAGPIVAAALRAVGRTAEADAILKPLNRMIAAGLARSRGQVPASFLAEAAPIWAMLGKADAAVSALETARRRGWSYIQPDEGDTSLSDIGDEPAFRSLRGHPRFERLRAGLHAQLERERRELARQIVPARSNQR